MRLTFSQYGQANCLPSNAREIKIEADREIPRLPFEWTTASWNGWVMPHSKRTRAYIWEDYSVGWSVALPKTRTRKRNRSSMYWYEGINEEKRLLLIPSQGIPCENVQIFRITGHDTIPIYAKKQPGYLYPIQYTGGSGQGPTQQSLTVGQLVEIRGQISVDPGWRILTFHLPS
jgi:hypothetical protein